MLNVKRRCRLNLNVSDDFYFNNNNNNNNNNDIKHENVDYAEKLCLQHNKCNCAIPEVCVYMVSTVINHIKNNIYRLIYKQLMIGKQRHRCNQFFFSKKLENCQKNSFLIFFLLKITFDNKWNIYMQSTIFSPFPSFPVHTSNEKVRFDNTICLTCLIVWNSLIYC